MSLEKTPKVITVRAYSEMFDISRQYTYDLIRENKIFQISNTMQMGKAEGQMLMENSLKDLISQKRIDPSDAE